MREREKKMRVAWGCSYNTCDTIRSPFKIINLIDLLPKPTDIETHERRNSMGLFQLSLCGFSASPPVAFETFSSLTVLMLEDTSISPSPSPVSTKAPLLCPTFS